MKSRAEQLDEISKAMLSATDRIRYYKQQDKMLQSEIKRLTRNERTHRLCTRGGMIEAFIQKPEKLSDDQVMELLTASLIIAIFISVMLQAPFLSLQELLSL